MTAEWLYDKLTACPKKIWFLIVVILGLCVALSLLLGIHFQRIPQRDQPFIQHKPPEIVFEEKKWKPLCPASKDYDCYPEKRIISEKDCSKRGCCWDDYRCYYPENYGYAKEGPVEVSHNAFEIPLRRIPSPSRYGKDAEHIRLRIEMQTSYRLRIKIYVPKENRYEVPEPRIPIDYSPTGKKLYEVTHSEEGRVFGLTVKRVGTSDLVFDMTDGKLVLSDQFLELTLKLASKHVFGENRDAARRWTMFDFKTSGPVHPMYLCMEPDTGNAHGVLLLNSNFMEMQYKPDPAMTFRTTGGILDFYVFLGPTPEDVAKQYSEATGRPAMPPFWSLGFQLGYSGYLSQSHLNWVLRNMRTHDIPQEVVYLDTAYMEDGQLFTVDTSKYPTFPKLISAIHEKEQKLVLSIHPQVSTKHPAYSTGRHQGVLINDTWGTQPIIGLMHDSPVVFPDFGNPVTYPWWKHYLTELHDRYKFDGLSLEENEPENQVQGSVQSCSKTSINFPPYEIKKKFWSVIFEKTLCMDSVHVWGPCAHQKHYNLHHLYGSAMSRQTHGVLESIFPTMRPHLISHAYFMGNSRYGGTLRKYNNATWVDLQNTVTDILLQSIQGFPYTGSSVCGYYGVAEEELCLRWFQLGAFNPLFLSMKSSQSLDQDPVRFSKLFIRVVRQAILRRYQLLPYLYTLFHRAHAYGETVARPLFHEFPHDHVTYTIKRQFLWGNGLLISPVLDEASNSVYAYFPSGDWYDFYTGEPLASEGQWETLDAPLYLPGRPIHLHVRGGTILPCFQKADNTTVASRKSPLKLYVGLNSTFQAEGELFWDDGVSKDTFEIGEYVIAKFFATKDKVETRGILGKRYYNVDFNQFFIQSVRIMGMNQKPQDITIDTDYHLTKKQFRWNQTFRVLDIFNVLIPLTRRTIIEWSS